MNILIVILIFSAIAGLIYFLRKGNRLTNSQYIITEPRQAIFKEEQSIIVELAGARHYKLNGRLNFKIGEQVFVFREPNNNYSSTAVKVVNTKGDVLGHIPQKYSTEACSIIDKGFHFLVFIENVDKSEPEYPYVTLKISLTKDASSIPLTKEMVEVIDNKKIKQEQEEKVKSDLAYELCKQGSLAEEKNDTDNAVSLYERAIKTEKAPPIAYKRLTIIYRKMKDYDNEIRVLNSWLDQYKKKSIDKNTQNEKVQDIKDRLLKAYDLKRKTTT